MNSKSRIVFKEWVSIVIGWILLMYLYNFITIWGMRHMLEESVLTEYYDSGYAHLELLIQGVVFGLLFALINTLTDRTRLRRKSFGAVILIRSGFYLLSFAIAGSITYMVFTWTGIISKKEWQETLNYITPLYAVSIVVYFILAIIFMNFILQVSRKFGPGVLIKLLLGKYHTPKNEQHIFMFMDLQGSTAIAERLGHNKYSQLMQDCFYDLTDIVIKHKASIYQYVGDEVVLTWKLKRGLQNINCIQTYFAFTKKLKQREAYYLKNFNTTPYFKCGLDSGEVTVAEIGEIKRELAYHGDVLNTAARIEKKCTPLKKGMIISENLGNALPPDIDGYKKELIGEIELKGKQGKINLYSIEQNHS